MGQGQREETLRYAAAVYGSEPEYLWQDTPDAAVLRHRDNRKWYALFMTVKREKLGLPGVGRVDILDVKCDPQMIGFLVSGSGFLPGYHMNKKNWITVLLDGTVEKEQIFSLLDQSFMLTAGKKQLKEIQKAGGKKL